MTGVATSDHDKVQCGYIKAKFALSRDLPLGHHKCYAWGNELTRCRVTQNFVYVSLGHKTLTSNAKAREYISAIHDMQGKITRIDFNIDYLGLLDFNAFYRLHDNDEKPTPSILKSPNGTTVYVGRRSSARMLRVYDKTAEIRVKEKVDIGFDITRIELEIKRNMVSRYVALFMSGKNDVILSDIQQLYGLRGFCESHKATKPDHNRDKSDGLWRFVTRYRRTIRRAYLTDIDEFLDILEVNDHD